MSKIEFQAYEAKNHYPVVMSKLPSILSNFEYHIDKNNMMMMDEAMFNHEKMKK